MRLLGYDTVEQYNPFLLLDIIDSNDATDYEAGFPLHPRRGIESITYLVSGELQYRIGSGSQGVLHSGGTQWLTAGSGVEYELLPQESEQMLYMQLWFNLPRKDKMTSPVIRTVSESKLPVVNFRGGKIKVIAGSYEQNRGLQGEFLPLNFYHIFIRKGEKLTLTSDPQEIVMIYLLRGSMKIGEEEIKENRVVLFGEGSEIDLEALHANAQALYFAAPKLDEPVSWGGPVVMNTEVDLLRTFEDLRRNEFIKEEAIELK